MNKVVSSVVFVIIFLVFIILNETPSGAAFLMDHMMVVGIAAIVVGMLLSWYISKLVDRKKDDEE
ncbi:MAG: hypothetical protein J6X26_04270 [Bacteroidales bacterium]|nr:hypothetical protein [Bacteroidales bacterium]